MGGVGATAGADKYGGSGSGAGGGTTGTGSSVGLSTEFTANNPQRMPVYNSPSLNEAAKRKRQEIAARSGRTSTNLVGNPGTRTYQSSFLGSVA